MKASTVFRPGVTAQLIFVSAAAASVIWVSVSALV